nr:CRISPR-associated endonuclease Cas2 [Pseudopontixanthobacter vadosimaris]
MARHETYFLSGYRLMWIMCMFDLPVDTKPNRKAATDFRHFLVDEGFEMSQLSIYARFCSGKEHYDTLAGRIGRHLPPQGDVHLVGFTDKQYENIVRFSSQRRLRARKSPGQLALFD